MRVIALAVAAILLGCGGNAPTILDAAVDGSATDGTADGPLACAGLDALACRTTAGCAPDFCDACDCAPTYAGCRAAAEPMAPCPVLDCPTPQCCHDDAACTASACFAPGESPGCGICRQVKSECASDAECRATAAGVGAVPICEPITCACTPASACVPGCLDDGDCGDAETCDAPSGRCHPRACSAAAPCPGDFDCSGGTCARRACVDDDACDGFCVEGACRDRLGTCAPPPV